MLDRTYTRKDYGVRPVAYLNSEALEKILKKAKVTDGSLMILLGEYPQTMVRGYDYLELEEAFSHLKVKKTGKVYTIGDQKCLEYIFKGQKYCKVNDKWFMVESIAWGVDKDLKCLISKKILLGNMPIDRRKGFSKQFHYSQLHEFLNDTFLHEITPSKINEGKNVNDDSLEQEYVVLKEENKEKMARIAELQKLIEEEKEKSIELDKKLEEFGQSVIGGSYVRR